MTEYQSTEEHSKPEAVEQAALFSGPAIAATLSLLLGFYTLMITHHISRLSKAMDKLIHSYGYWIPGSTGIGPDGSIGSFSGKETLALLAWGLSWAIFHMLWRQVDLPVHKWLPIFLGALLLVTLGFIHPIIDPLILLLIDIFG